MNIKQTTLACALVASCGGVFAQSSDSASTSGSNAAAVNSNTNNISGTTANIGASNSNSTSGSNSTSNINARNTNMGNGASTSTSSSGSRSGSYASSGGAANSQVVVNFSGTDPASGSSGNSGTSAQPQSLAQQTPQGADLGSASNPITSKSEVKTVGNPGAMSFSSAFSQYNCANTGGIGGGWLGGALNIGGPIESGPCNARANAAALMSMATMYPDGDPMKRKLLDAAVRLVGDSTGATAAALQKAQVDFFTTQMAKAPANPAITPPGMVPQVPTISNVPGVYVGNDPIVMQRLGITAAK